MYLLFHTQSRYNKILLLCGNRMLIKNFVANVLAGAVSALMLGGCVTTHVQRPLSVGVPSEGTAVTVSITANTDEVNGLGQITLGRLSSGDAVSSLVL